MNWLRYIALGLFSLGLSSLHAQMGPAATATLSRDVWGDAWFPEWNTDGNASFAQGYRNTVAHDPYPGIWSAEGDQLVVTKVIEGLGEDRWRETAILVFAQDASGEWVRFGSWTSTPNTKGSRQTIHFTIPAWSRGQIKWEVWAWYGAASNITNFQYNPLSKRWVNHLVKSHLSVAFGDTGISVESIKPTQLALRATLSNPSAKVSPSTTRISLGGSVLFNLEMEGGLNSSAQFSGSGVDVKDPPSAILVTPVILGPQTYRLQLPGYTTLVWDRPVTGNTLILRTPHGDVDVTNVRFYVVSKEADAGSYSIVQITNAGVASDPQPLFVALPASFVSTAQIDVSAPAATVVVSPQPASYTVQNGPAAGRSFRRSWSDGAGWHAYLGRQGVTIDVQAMSSDSAIASIELQAKTPNGDWSDLVAPQTVDAAQANGPGVKVSQRFSVRLGHVRADKPLVPSDPTLAGSWQLRARALTGANNWSDWSSAVPLAVEMPLQSVSKTGQTLPPVKDAAWFTASEAKTYNINLWIP